MLTLRIHLDSAHETNAPLLIAPGSHRLGRIEETDIAELVQQLGSKPCLAARGDAWLYRTLILHASEAASQPTSRRVLQVDYSAEELPEPLAWLGA
jgi:ectoine hydroxylase-related dioxygenase (phytanoyl-CoA dioxygenase family)